MLGAIVNLYVCIVLIAAFIGAFTPVELASSVYQIISKFL